MRRSLLLLTACSIILSYSSCQKSEKTPTAKNSLEDLTTTAPSILADGISSLPITATVLDSSGTPVGEVRVFFTANAGTIDKFAFTDNNGHATATLVSIASEADVRATVKASLGALEKGEDHRTITLQCPGMEPEAALAKAGASLTDPASLTVTFNGVLFENKLDVSELPADGLSSTNLTMTVRERRTKKIIPNSKIYLRANYTTIDAEAVTNDQGNAVVKVLSFPKAVTDSIHMDFGNRLRYRTAISYVAPKLVLLPENVAIQADGMSKTEFTARLISHRNAVIPGATIQFTTSAGSITASNLTDKNGEATATLTSSTILNSNVQVIARFYDVADTAKAAFVEQQTQLWHFVFAPLPEILRDGVSVIPIKATLYNATNVPVINTRVQFSAQRGTIDNNAVTDSLGQLTVQYTPDTGETDAMETITGTVGELTQNFTFTLLGVTLQISADPVSMPADGTSSSKITAVLKETTNLYAIPDARLEFSTTLGTIPRYATTDAAGTASVSMTAGTTAGTAIVTARFGKLTKTVRIELLPEKPNSIVLNASPQFIWVRETGELEQTMISATVLDEAGRNMRASVAIRFTLLHGPNGGEFIEPAETGSETVSQPIQTANGVAKVKLRSGIRPGTVEIRAQLVDYPEISARTTTVVIRSGPPYIYIDPTDKNHVESHMSIAFDHLNLPGWMFIDNFNVSLYVGDKYNNPVEQSTTIYLRSSGGIIGTDISTDEKGIGAVEWYTANPMPVAKPIDLNVLSPHYIPNPNDPTRYLPVTLPDLDGDGVENNGVAVVLATTHGRDQDGNDAIVFAVGRTVFSGPIQVFDVTSDKSSLKPGETANIVIRLYDINGNPVAYGSELKAEASTGDLSAKDLLVKDMEYGFGYTLFQTQLTNNLDSSAPADKMATVTISLKSRNGSTSQSVQIMLLKQ